MVDEPTRFSQGSRQEKPSLVEKTARLEFNKPGIDKFVSDRGIKALWERSWYCTCRNPKTLAPDPTCPICLGRGVAYGVAIPTKIMLVNQKKGPMGMELGLYDSGSALATSVAGDAISYRDRLTIPEVKVYQSMIFNVTPDRVKRGMYLYYDAKELTLVKGAINGQQGIDLSQGTDYEMDYDKNIFKPASHLMGTNISINLETVLRYIVIDLLKESRYQYTEKDRKIPEFEELPRLLVLKREDLFINPEPFVIESQTDKALSAQERNDGLLEAKKKSTGGFFGGAIGG